jgi:hypothetical protein
VENNDCSLVFLHHCQHLNGGEWSGSQIDIYWIKLVLMSRYLWDCVKSSQINYQRNGTERNKRFFPSLTVEAVDSLQTLFRAPDRWFRVKARCRRSRPDQVDYWEGVLHLLYNKICLKMIGHGSRSTWGPGPSGSGFRAQNYDPPPLKQTFPTTFVI